jgi:hypothetical protein
MYSRQWCWRCFGCFYTIIAVAIRRVITKAIVSHGIVTAVSHRLVDVNRFYNIFGWQWHIFGVDPIKMLWGCIIGNKRNSANTNRVWAWFPNDSCSPCLPFLKLRSITVLNTHYILVDWNDTVHFLRFFQNHTTKFNINAHLASKTRKKGIITKRRKKKWENFCYQESRIESKSYMNRGFIFFPKNFIAFNMQIFSNKQDLRIQQ